MKWISLFVFVIMGFFAFQYYMKSNKIIYKFKEPIFKYTTTNPDTVVNAELKFTTMELIPWNNDAIWVYFIYSENWPNAQNLQSIKAFLIDPNGKELISDAQLDIEFHTKDKNDQVQLVSVSKKNNTTPLNELVDWSKVNYKYTFADVVYEKKDNAITYKNDYKFSTKSYPDSLKFLVEIKWTNGERKFETMLTKEKYVGPKINPKF